MAFRYLKPFEITPKLVDWQNTLLTAHRADGWGTELPFELDGKPYIARIERHYHTPGGPLYPYGVHTGCSLGIDDPGKSRPREGLPRDDNEPAKPACRKPNLFRFSKHSLDELESVDDRLIRVMLYAIQITDIDFVIIEGRRSLERQKQLYAEGNTLTLHSRHLTGHAVDIAPYVEGRISWSWGDFNRLAPHIRKAASDLGIPIEWGAEWRPALLRDGPHWQIPSTNKP